MLHFDQHLQGVIHAHRQIVNLIQVHLVSIDALQEYWVEVTLPIQESAPGGFMHILLPVRDDIDLPSAVFETLLRVDFEDVLENQAFAVVDHSFTEEVVATA